MLISMDMLVRDTCLTVTLISIYKYKYVFNIMHEMCLNLLLSYWNLN